MCPRTTHFSCCTRCVLASLLVGRLTCVLASGCSLTLWLACRLAAAPGATSSQAIVSWCLAGWPAWLACRRTTNKQDARRRQQHTAAPVCGLLQGVEHPKEEGTYKPYVRTVRLKKDLSGYETLAHCEVDFELTHENKVSWCPTGGSQPASRPASQPASGR